MAAHAYLTAELTFFAELEDIALEPGDRASRACRAASRIRHAWPLRHVALFDVVNGDAVLVGSSGEPSSSAEDDGADVVVPVTSLEGDLVGTLEVQARKDARIGQADRLRLEACAGVLWWLWVSEVPHADGLFGPVR